MYYKKTEISKVNLKDLKDDTLYHYFYSNEVLTDAESYGLGRQIKKSEYITHVVVPVKEVNERDVNDFINKWRNWWILNKDSKTLDVAFERELRSLLQINKNEKEVCSHITILNGVCVLCNKPFADDH